MSLPLRGLRVGLHGRDRAIFVAGRCLADLGADVRALSAPAVAADSLWLGSPQAALPGERFDVALRGPGLEASAPCVVTYRSVSSAAANAGQVLDERELSAAGGIAVAVGEPGRPPLPMPDGAVDTLVGSHLAASALAAVLDGVRETEVAGADVVAWAVATNRLLYLPGGLAWHRAGRRANGSGGSYPYALFEARDGLFCIIGRTARDWQLLKAAMGDPAWSRRSRFADPQRVGRAYPDEADAYVAPWVARHTRAQLMHLVAERGLAGAPVLRPEEVLEFPALAGRWRGVDHRGAALRVPGPVSDHVASGGSGSGKSLSQLRVLDLSWVWSGPAVSVALADLGADVIKIESATRPDNSRLRGRPLHGIRDDQAPSIELQPYFHALNRGKRSVSLDLRTSGGRELLWELAQHADVIVENLSAGVMDRFGIAPERVLEHNPSCVFLSMRGFQSHPTTERLKAYAPTLSSAAGLEALIGYPGETPVGAMTVAFSDALAAGQGILLALAGLYRRAAHGAGGAITLSQHAAAVLANGRNLVDAQLGKRSELRPFADDAGLTVSGEGLDRSPWISADLIAAVRPRFLDAVPVARLPWRRDGALPRAGAPAPLLGEHTDEVLKALLSIGDARRDALAREGALT